MVIKENKKGKFSNYAIKILKYFEPQLQCVLCKLQMILHKTADHTTQKYRPYYTEVQVLLQLQIVL